MGPSTPSTPACLQLACMPAYAAACCGHVTAMQQSVQHPLRPTSANPSLATPALVKGCQCSMLPLPQLAPDRTGTCAAEHGNNFFVSWHAGNQPFLESKNTSTQWCTLSAVIVHGLRQAQTLVHVVQSGRHMCRPDTLLPAGNHMLCCFIAGHSWTVTRHGCTWLRHPRLLPCRQPHAHRLHHEVLPAAPHDQVDPSQQVKM
jgi:hypothetical protein